MERGERGLNALALFFGDKAGQHLPELRVLSARVDILPAVSLEERRRDRLRLVLADRTATFHCEIGCIGPGLRLQMPSTAATSSMNSSTARSRCCVVRPAS